MPSPFSRLISTSFMIPSGVYFYRIRFGDLRRIQEDDIAEKYLLALRTGGLWFLIPISSGPLNNSN
jgi:hypothetical protein